MNTHEIKEIVDEQMIVGNELLRLISKGNSERIAKNASFFRGKTIKADSFREELNREVNFLTRFLPFWAAYYKTDLLAGQRIFAYFAHFNSIFSVEPRERAQTDQLFAEANELWARVVQSYITRDYEQYKIDVIDFLVKILAIGGTQAIAEENFGVLTAGVGSVSVKPTPLGRIIT